MSEKSKGAGILISKCPTDQNLGYFRMCLKAALTRVPPFRHQPITSRSKDVRSDSSSRRDLEYFQSARKILKYVSRAIKSVDAKEQSPPFLGYLEHRLRCGGLAL